MSTACAPEPSPGLEQPPSAWVTGSMHRVGETEVATGRTDHELAAARGGTDSFQVVVAGGRSGLTGVELEVGELTGPDGAALPASAVTRYREHYVEVTATSPDRSGTNRPGGPGRYADGLIPFVHPDTGEPLDGELRAAGAEVAPGLNQPYWIDVAVPADAVPGIYEGTWTATADGFRESGRITLTVSTIQLPARPSLRSVVLNWTGRTAVSRELLRHKLVPTSALPDPDDPLSQVVNVADVGLFSGADEGRCRLDPPPPVERIRAAAAREERSGALLLNYTADEIGGCDDVAESVRAWSRALHEAGVAQLLTQAPDPALFDDGTGRPAVDVWAMLPKQYEDDPELVAEARARGAEVWSYNALAQDGYSPKWLLDFAPIDFRIQPGFLNQQLGLGGILYWRADAWTDRPWDDVYAYSPDGYPGEGQLLYPGEQVGIDGGAVPSMRLKWLRDGVEDFELIGLARDRDPAGTDAAVRSVARDWQDWSPDPHRLAQARTVLLRLAGG
ncbi:glycoside hydrolase domain-containing protein [Pseudonocardia nematodicida]|uniref:Glycoside hydrolase domain-containing protein n=1 Tax=Pseudonocardia nematodicida TaxID=1206997 RepID=A0ABV1K3R6_9PSEU